MAGQRPEEPTDSSLQADVHYCTKYSPSSALGIHRCQPEGVSYCLPREYDLIALAKGLGLTALMLARLRRRNRFPAVRHLLV
jgi:hypothetical protein